MRNTAFDRLVADEGLDHTDRETWLESFRHVAQKQDELMRLCERARTDPFTFIQLVGRRDRFSKAEKELAAKERRTLSYLMRLEPIQEDMVDFVLEHPRTVVRSSPETGKSSIGTVLLNIWLAGNNLREFCGKISSLNTDFANAFSRQIADYVENNPFIRMVFPEMRRDPVKWAERERYLIRPEGSYVRDPHWYTNGAEGAQIGKRVLWDFADDIQSMESTSTEEKSDKTLMWFIDGESRMVQGSHRCVFCNALRSYDMGHKLVREFGYKLFLLSVRDRKGRTTLPCIWSQERIETYPEPLKARHIDCKADTETDALFKAVYINRCKQQGAGLTSLRSTVGLDLPEGMQIHCGIDLMHGKHNKQKPVRGRVKKTDDTVFTTCLNGPRHTFVQLFPLLEHRLPRISAEFIMPINILRGKMESPEVKGCIYEHALRYPGVVFIVEDIGAQDYIRQDMLIAEPTIRIVPFTTGGFKHDEIDGVTGMDVDHSAGMTIYPSWETAPGVFECEPELKAMHEEMAKFTRGSHPGDALMSLFFVRNHVRRLRGSPDAHSGPRLDTLGISRAEALIRGPGGASPMLPWQEAISNLTGAAGFAMPRAPSSTAQPQTGEPVKPKPNPNDTGGIKF